MESYAKRQAKMNANNKKSNENNKFGYIVVSDAVRRMCYMKKYDKKTGKVVENFINPQPWVSEEELLKFMLTL